MAQQPRVPLRSSVSDDESESMHARLLGRKWGACTGKLTRAVDRPRPLFGRQIPNIIIIHWESQNYSESFKQ